VAAFVIDILFKVLVLGIATGAISLVLTKSTVFNFLHDWLEAKVPFLGEMLNCPWCTSHWIALFFTLIYRPLLVNVFAPVDYLVTIMVMVVIAAVTARIIYSAYKPIMG
jgi:Protein of unknown function (DUF1360)